MTLLGVGFGLLLGLGIGQVVQSMLYRVSPFDPVAFAVAPLVLVVTALLACWLPARRATKVNPLVALRSE
jgi:putative ABC transport system permease protein